MPKHRRAISSREEAESFGYIALFIGFVATYLGAEAVLVARPHPTHWLAAAAGAVLAGGGAYGYTLWRRARRHRH